jgi:hypothetical protein
VLRAMPPAILGTLGRQDRDLASGMLCDDCRRCGLPRPRANQGSHCIFRRSRRIRPIVGGHRPPTFDRFLVRPHARLRPPFAERHPRDAKRCPQRRHENLNLATVHLRLQCVNAPSGRQTGLFFEHCDESPPGVTSVGLGAPTRYATQMMRTRENSLLPICYRI